MNTAVSCFAGVGGFDLALERNGYDVVAQIEIDKHAQTILRRHYPNAELYSDITEVTGHDLVSAGFNPVGGIITGGFPCQDLSVAGKRAGLGGSRSGLFWEIHRLIAETKTEWFILENVPGLLSSNGGRDMGIVVTALVELGYGVAWRVLDAQHFGVPQRRRRVFIVGHSSGEWSRAAAVLAVGESVRGDSAASDQAREDAAAGATGSVGGSGSGSGGRVGTLYNQSSFAGYTEGGGTLTATTYKRPEDNVVVHESTAGTE